MSADGTALMYDLAALGIQIWMILIAFFVVPTFKNKKNIVTFGVVLFMYINTTLGQSDIFYPSLLILSFGYQLSDKCIEKS